MSSAVMKEMLLIRDKKNKVHPVDAYFLKVCLDHFSANLYISINNPAYEPSYTVCIIPVRLHNLLGDAVDKSSGYSMILPVLRAIELEDRRFLIKGDINGTCFSIGESFMLTAGHVAETNPGPGKECLTIGICGPDGYFKSAKVVRAEKLPCDLGILEIEFVYADSQNWFYRLPWSEKVLQPFECVRGSGYPYGMHVVDDHRSVVVRGFQGHVVSGVDNFSPLGIKLDPFKVYELSFMAPRGLSGAPLTNCSGTLAVHGVIIGNSQSRMMIIRSTETEVEAGITSHLEQYEALSLGVAVQAEEVFKQQSKLLGMTIGEHLKKNKLLT